MPPTYLDVHVLQTVPPSNINRDDTGAPKSATYGGARRARVSSQAWKRATRAAYQDELDTSDVGYRTKRVVKLIVDEMTERQPELSDEEARARAEGVLKPLGIKVEKPRVKAKSKTEDADAEPEAEAEGYALTEYLIFFSARQIERLAELALASEQGKVAKKEALEAADTEHGMEVGLFGRMVADNKDLSVDAAVQVAHAISTHAVDTEQDYYTAVDDKNPADETGAGMLGTIEFNSATLYRYATINLGGLRANLGDGNATVRAAQAFVRAFVSSMPTGKQNTFANRTVPDAVLISVRHDQPVNLVAAFEEPVELAPALAHDGTAAGGYVRASAERLAKYAGEIGSFVSEPELTLVVRTGDRTDVLDSVGEVVTLDEALRRLEAPVERALAPDQGA